MDANHYYQNLLQQGHSPVDAAHFTSQYYPGFQAPMQGAGMMAPQPTGMDMGAMEFGGMASSGMGAPAGFGAGMGAEGMAAGAGMAATGAAVGGGMSFATIAVVSVLVLGGAGTAGYFIYDSFSESEETKPEFYGTVYWMDYSFAYQFEEDGIKMVTTANSSDDCESYSDIYGSEGNTEYKNGLCYIDMYESYTSENKGDYYEICVIIGEGENDCSDIYALDRGAVFYTDGVCNALVSAISTPKYEATVDERNEWIETRAEIAEELEDEICGGLAENSEVSFDYYQFEARDAAGAMSEAAGDRLVNIMMTQAGEPLSWSVLKVRIVVDNGNSLTCVEENQGNTNAACTYSINEESQWGVSEEITISEGDSDLCDGSNGGCEIDVTIIKLGVSNEDDVILAMIQSYAEP